jgi:hypothetical protein
MVVLIGAAGRRPNLQTWPPAPARGVEAGRRQKRNEVKVVKFVQCNSK